MINSMSDTRKISDASLIRPAADMRAVKLRVFRFKFRDEFLFFIQLYGYIARTHLPPRPIDDMKIKLAAHRRCDQNIHFVGLWSFW